jgi:hypothetical protein
VCKNNDDKKAGKKIKKRPEKGEALGKWNQKAKST